MLTIKINIVENVLDDFKHFYGDEEFIEYNNKLTTAEIASNNQQHRPADACINWHKKKRKKKSGQHPIVENYKNSPKSTDTIVVETTVPNFHANPDYINQGFLGISNLLVLVVRRLD